MFLVVVVESDVNLCRVHTIGLGVLGACSSVTFSWLKARHQIAEHEKPTNLGLIKKNNRLDSHAGCHHPTLLYIESQYNIRGQSTSSEVATCPLSGS